MLYAIGQDVGVGEVGNLLERFIASAHLERKKIVYYANLFFVVVFCF